MIRFARCTGLLSLLIFCLFWYFTAHFDPFAFFNSEYPVWAAKTVLGSRSSAGKLLVLGDSRALVGIEPAKIDRRIVNLAMGGATPIECYFTSRRILARRERPLGFILSLSIEHLTHAECFWERAVRFDYLHREEIEEVVESERRLHDPEIMGTTETERTYNRFLQLLLPLRFPSFLYPEIRSSSFGSRKKENEERFRVAIASGGSVSYGRRAASLDLDKEAALTGFQPSPVLDFYLGKTLDLLADNRLPVYFVAGPVNEVSRRVYRPSMVEEFSRYFRQVQVRHPNLQLLGSLMTVRPADQFTDCAHLNDPAADRWSREVQELLNGAHVPGSPFRAPPDS